MNKKYQNKLEDIENEIDSFKKKKTILPKKPVTKRDKHFYDMGAEQQVKVFSDMHEDWSRFAPMSRKDLGDYQKSEMWYTSKRNITIALCVILCVIALLYAMAGDQESLKAGFIH